MALPGDLGETAKGHLPCGMEYTLEYYSATKKNEMMPFAATWIGLEMIILSEVSQTEKDKYCMISLMWNLKKVKLVSITQKRLTWGIPWWSSWLGFSIFTAVGQGSIIG